MIRIAPRASQPRARRLPLRRPGMSAPRAPSPPRGTEVGPPRSPRSLSRAVSRSRGCLHRSAGTAGMRLSGPRGSRTRVRAGQGSDVASRFGLSSRSPSRGLGLGGRDPVLLQNHGTPSTSSRSSSGEQEWSPPIAGPAARSMHALPQALGSHEKVGAQPLFVRDARKTRRTRARSAVGSGLSPWISGARESRRARSRRKAAAGSPIRRPTPPSTTRPRRVRAPTERGPVGRGQCTEQTWTCGSSSSEELLELPIQDVFLVFSASTDAANFFSRSWSGLEAPRASSTLADLRGVFSAW